MNAPNKDTIDRVLNNSATKAEIKIVLNWFTTPKGEEYLSEIMDNDIDLIKDENLFSDDVFYKDKEYGKLISKINKRQIRIKLLKIAAVFVPLVTICGGLIWGLFSEPKMVTVTASKGERLHIILQDETNVFLNSGSTLTYPERFGFNSREVSLNGEAYFDVSHNKNKDFEVMIGNEISVRVLGTEFNINAFGDRNEVFVTLAEGVVEVTTSEQNYKLKPSEKISLERKNPNNAIIQNIDTKRLTMWHENIIAFDDATFTDVIKTLSEWYNIEFDVKNTKAYEYNLTMISEKNPLLINVLDEIELITPIRFKKEGSKIIVECE